MIVANSIFSFGKGVVDESTRIVKKSTSVITKKTKKAVKSSTRSIKKTFAKTDGVAAAAASASVPPPLSTTGDDLESTPLLGGQVDGDDDSSSSMSSEEEAEPFFPGLEKDIKEMVKGFTDGYTAFENTRTAVELAVFYLAIYITVGVVAFSFVFERWTIVKSVYFCVVTFTTVGYGDLSPSTDAGRLFMIFYCLFGIVVLGVFLGIAGNFVVEANEAAMAKVKERSTKRMINKLEHENDTEGNETPPTEEGDFHHEKTFREAIVEIILLELPIVALIGLLALIIGYTENWSIITSLYWSVITSTTIGFGDLYPQSEYTELVCIFFLPLAVAVFGEILGRIASLAIERRADALEHEFMNRELTMKDLVEMDGDKDGKVHRGEFVVYMLLTMGKVELEDVEELRAAFARLDADGNGTLERSDILAKSGKRMEKLPKSRRLSSEG